MSTITPEIIEALEGQGMLDERARTLLHLLAGQAADTEPEPTPPAVDRRRAQSRALLRQRLSLIGEELDELRHRNQRLAEALGACPLCWGESAECPECRGRGSPGSAPPDPDLYRAVVFPAVTAMTPSMHGREQGAPDG